jgi:hypothetical protein
MQEFTLKNSSEKKSPGKVSLQFGGIATVVCDVQLHTVKTALFYPCTVKTVNQKVVLGIIFRQCPRAVNNRLITPYTGEVIRY